MSIKVQVASVSDRERLVAELWLNDVQLAEVSREGDRFEVEVYPGVGLIPLDLYMEALDKARSELMK